MAFFPQQQQQQQQLRGMNSMAADDGQIPPFFSAHPPGFAQHQHQPQPHQQRAFGVAADGYRLQQLQAQPQAREQEFLGENSQLSSIDFLQSGPETAAAVSTGLALSFEDHRRCGINGVGGINGSGTAAAAVSLGESPLILLPMVDEDISLEVQRMDAEMDSFIKAQSERLRQSILEKVQTKQFQALASVKHKILQKIREKETEAETINKRNVELEDQIKQLAMEVGAWQQRAKYNESMINALKYNLEQFYTHQNRDYKEGCGDSEVDDTASCCNGDATTKVQLFGKDNRLKESLACRFCKANEACMLLLPCRHLCLCKDCETKMSFCPICQSSKILGMEIYL